MTVGLVFGKLGFVQDQRVSRLCAGARPPLRGLCCFWGLVLQKVAGCSPTAGCTLEPAMTGRDSPRLSWAARATSCVRQAPKPRNIAEKSDLLACGWISRLCGRMPSAADRKTAPRLESCQAGASPHSTYWDSKEGKGPHFRTAPAYLHTVSTFSSLAVAVR